MELIALIVLAFSGAAVVALLLAGLFTVPWLLIGALLVLMVVLINIPVPKTRSPQVESVSDSMHSAVSPASSSQNTEHVDQTLLTIHHALRYRGTVYEPKQQSQADATTVMLEHSGTYRGRHWKAKDIQVKG